MNEKNSTRFLSAILIVTIAGFLAVILMSTRLQVTSSDTKELSNQILNRLIVQDEDPCLYDSTGIVRVPYKNALGFIQNYLDSNPEVRNEPVKAYSITAVQFRAISNMMRKDQSVAGVRLYLGLNERMEEIMVIVGTDREGIEMKTFAYITERGRAGLCPPICD